MREDISFKFDQTVVISGKAFMKMQYWTEMMKSYEIGGMLVIEETQDQIFVEDVLLPEQEVSSAEVDMTGDGMAKLFTYLANKKPELVPKIRGWWHSHHNMGVGWSTTDDNTSEMLSKRLGSCLAINTDSSGNILVRLDIYDPFKMVIDNIPYMIEYEDAKIKKFCEKEMEKKITKPTVVTNNLNRYYPYQGYYNDNDEYSYKEEYEEEPPQNTVQPIDYPWHVHWLPDDYYRQFMLAAPALTVKKRKRLAKKLYTAAEKKGTLLETCRSVRVE